MTVRLWVQTAHLMFLQIFTMEKSSDPSFSCITFKDVSLKKKKKDILVVIIAFIPQVVEEKLIALTLMTPSKY